MASECTLTRACRYDKHVELIEGIATEQERVLFLKSAAEQMLLKAQIKLNLKHLYQVFAFHQRSVGSSSARTLVMKRFASHQHSLVSIG
tara:strand:+ start:1351 stop:1617 length:267 start_codon:yes stop_codon:yes gene_type:complete